MLVSFSYCIAYDNNKVAPTENMYNRIKSISSSYVVYDNSKYSPTENMYNQMKSISSSYVVYDNSKYSPTDNLKNKYPTFLKTKTTNYTNEMQIFFLLIYKYIGFAFLHN